MKLHTGGGFALATLVTSTGIAFAAPGQDPGDAGPDDSDPKNAEHVSGETSPENGAAAADDANADDSRPGTDPPDHAARIQDLIRQYLDGTRHDSLDDEAAAENATSANAR